MALVVNTIETALVKIRMARRNTAHANGRRMIWNDASPGYEKGSIKKNEERKTINTIMLLATKRKGIFVIFIIINAITREATATGRVLRSATTNINKPRDTILTLGSHR